MELNEFKELEFDTDDTVGFELNLELYIALKKFKTCVYNRSKLINELITPSNHSASLLIVDKLDNENH